MSNPLIGQPEPRSSALVRFGVIVRADNGTLALSVDGAVQASRWLQNYTPTYGDKVAFVVIRDALGQSSNLVVGRLGEAAAIRPDEGTVTAVGSGTATVTAAGATLTVKTVGTAPVVGDLLLLDHRPTAVYAIGKVTATTAVTPSLPTMPLPPPGQPGQGVQRFPATDTRTAIKNGAWSQKDGRSVIQGTYGGVSYAGSWFHGTGPASLSGKTLSEFKVYLPARLRIGAFDAAATFHLYATADGVPGATDPVRLIGPHDVTVPPGWAGGWVNVPLTFAAQVVSGGGIGIEGTPYAGFVGRDVDPMSGASEFTWTT